MNKEKNIRAGVLVDHQDLDIQKMCGTWYIIKTTLNFWQARSNPRFIYTLRRKAPLPQMFDTTRHGALSQRQIDITGIDTQDIQQPKVFRWRGTQWYSHFITSEWCVLDHDERYQEWMIIYFSATPFTQAGIDICDRSTAIADATLQELVQRIASNEHIGTQFANKFFAPHHEVKMEALRGSEQRKVEN